MLFKRDGHRPIPNGPDLRLACNGSATRHAEGEASAVADRSAKVSVDAPPPVAGRLVANAPFQRKPDCAAELGTGLVHELRLMLARGQTDVVLGSRILFDPAECSDGLDKMGNATE